MFVFSTEKPEQHGWQHSLQLVAESSYFGGTEFPEVLHLTGSNPQLNKEHGLIRPLIRLALLMVLTWTLVEATPAHVYKNFPPPHKVKALSAETKVPTEKPAPQPAPAVTPAVATQTETPAPTPVVEPVQPPAPVVTPVTGCGSDPNMAYIYQHESGCNTASINASSGACGLGQALPCSKLPCTLSDWSCQNSFFVTYAIERYGSTGAAAAFWSTHSWW